jgi:hemerythrin
MAVIDWKEIYATNIVALDNEHRKLIFEINRLYEAIRDKRSDAVLGDILAMLVQYTVEHFAHEEKLMEKYGYSGLEEHKQVHQDLIQAVGELKEKAGSAGTEELARQLLKFLRYWVLEHIVEVDKKYGSFLEARGGRFIE